MAIVYSDSTACAKLIVEEDGSELAAAGRDHRLGADDQRSAEAAWEEIWAATRAVELTETITVHAGELAGTHGLPGADAVHLASMLAVGPGDTLFAVWDKRLRSGAETAGVQVVPSLHRRGLESSQSLYRLLSTGEEEVAISYRDQN